MAEAEATIDALARNSTITDELAGTTSVYAVLAPDGESKPYITYEVIDETPTHVMGSADTTPTEFLFSVNIFADTFLQIVDASTAVLSVFSRYSGQAVGTDVTQHIFYAGRSDFYDEADRDYQRTMDFRLFLEV